jgi:hypothetical protein
MELLMKKMILTLLINSMFIFASSSIVLLPDSNINNENIRVNSSDIFNTKITFEIDDYNLIEADKADGKIVRLSEGAQILKKGAPDLPKKTSSIIIPDNQKMEVNIIHSDFVEYQNINILPSKGNLSRQVNPDDIPYEFGAEYNKNEFYPKELAQLGEPYILRDVRGISIITYPIQYNPITKVLRVYSEIEVEIVSKGRDVLNVLNRNEDSQKRSFEFENIYKSHFINMQNDLRFDYVSDHGNMLIISNEAFLSTMEPLVEWKTRKGIPVEMISVSEAGGNASSIKSFITNYYQNNGLTFLLLVGDEGQVPSIYVSGSASDPSYGFIDGNDSYSEVIVGRFSGQNPAQIETQVERSINYERYPNSSDWYQKALGIASNQGPGMNGYSDDDFNDWLWESVLSQYSYNNYDGIYDSNGGSVNEGINAINSGANIINYTGHGSISSWGNGAPLGTLNINALTNVDELPFVITVGCNVGEFQSTNECFSEAWQRSTHNGQPAGAIANMGSTISQSWEPPMHGQWAMNKILTESFDGVSGTGEILSRTFGGIATNGCLHMNDAQGSSGINETNYWTFFGDPTINVRTMPPTELSANFESTIIIGQENFTVNTGNEGDLVALSRNGSLLTSGYTSSNGIVNLNIQSASSIPGNIDIVISSYNKYIYEGELMVISPDGAYLIMDNYTENSPIIFGSNSEISLQFSNIGSESAENTQLELLCNDEFVEIINPIINLGNILSDQVIEASDIELQTSPNIPDEHQILINYYLSSSNEEWEGSFNLIASAPKLEIQNININATCGTLMPGGIASISADIINSGSIALDNPNIDVSTNANSNISEVSQDFVASLFNNQSLSINFDIEIGNGVQLGTDLNPQIEITSSDVEGYFGIVNFNLLIGVLLENFESGDFGCHNWTNLNQNSWTVTSLSSSSGNYSAVSAQIGDNQTSSLSIIMNVVDEGFLEFDYRVDAEYSSSGDYFYDGLEFYIDGELQEQFQSNSDGSSPWKNVQYTIPAGGHDFVWTFVKDGGGGSTDCNSTNCLDGALIDNIKFPFSEPNGIAGDINNDGFINVLDIVLTVSIILNDEYNSFADINNDGSINVLDIVQIVNLIL